MKHTRIMIMATAIAGMLALTGCGKENQADTSSTESTQPVKKCKNHGFNPLDFFK